MLFTEPAQQCQLKTSPKLHLVASIASRIFLPKCSLFVCRSHLDKVIRTDRFNIEWYFFPALVLILCPSRTDDNKAPYVDNWKWYLLVNAHHAPTPVTCCAVNLATKFKILVLLRLWMWFYDNTILVTEA